MTQKANDMAKKLRKRKEKEPLSFLSTGSTLLNLACSGKADGGFPKGKYVFLVGDSVSGKTFLSLTCLAEASLNKEFDGYRFIYDNAEDGALMDIDRFFGKKVAEQIEPPSLIDDEPIYSETIEEFYYHVDDANKEGRPYIYILDSMDALSSFQEADKFEEQKSDHRKGKELTGAMGDGKAKINSQNIRRIKNDLRSLGSILIIINQTRDNLGFGFEKKTRSGGRALKFYAALEMWSSVKGKIKRQVNKRDRQIGTDCKIEVKKNRITGKESSVQVPIYCSYGIDDVGSCIDYLIQEKHWTRTKQGIDAKQFGYKGTKDALITKIEREKLQGRLQKVVEDVWNEIEEACHLKREARY